MGQNWPFLRALSDQGVQVRIDQRACADLAAHNVLENACVCPSDSLAVCLFVCLLQDASGHSNVLKAGKAEELKNARKRRTARKAN